jgi:hypothetical protein
MKKIYVLLLAMITYAMSINAQVIVTGDGAGGSPYANLELAINAVNAVGTLTQPTTITTTISETVTVNGGYQITAIGSATNTLIINGGGNTYTAFDIPAVPGGALNDAVFKLIGADYVTIQNFIIVENPANTVSTIASNDMTEWGIALLYASTTNGSQNNSIQNNTISLNRTYTNTFGIYSNTRHSATAVTTTAEVTAASGSNSFNKIYSNTISNVNYGIVFIGAGTTIAAIDNGNDIGGSSVATGNTLSNWGGIGLATSAYTSLTTINCGINLNQQINDNISFNNITSFAGGLTTTISLTGIFKAYSVASPTGTITSNINNNTISVSAAPTTGFVQGIASSGLAALSTSTFNFNNNVITNFSITGAAATTGSIVGITNSSAPGTLNINNNIFSGGSRTGTTGQVQGITNSGAAVNAININNNQFGTASADYAVTSTAGSGTVFGISNSGAGSTCVVTIQNNDVRRIVHSVAVTSAHFYIINSGVGLSENISNNTFTNLNVNTTGNVTFISNSVAAPAAGFKIINNNSIVTAFNKAGAGGTVALYTDGASSVCTTPVQNNNNNFSNITVTGATIITGWFNNDGTAATPQKVITGNTFTNWTGGTSAVTVLQGNFGGSATFSNNIISNITGQGAVTALLQGASGTVANLAIINNQITNVTSTGTGGAVLGISNSSATTASTNISGNKINTLSSTGASVSVQGIVTASGTTVNLSRDTVINLTVTGATAPTVRGIQVTSGTTVTIDSAQINTFTSSGAGAVTMQGINVAGGTTTNTLHSNINALNNNATGVNSVTYGYVLAGGSGTNLVSNNFISNLTASGSGLVTGVVGIYHNTTVATLKAYYNTVNIGAISGATNFGAAGVVFPVSGTTLLDLKNNIININATPNGTGVAAAVRRAGTGTANTAPVAANFAANNNIYNINSGAQNYLYVDATSTANTVNGYAVSGLTPSVPNNIVNDANFNTSCGLYKVFMGAREGATYSENNLVAGPFPATFVPSGASYAESNGGATTPATTNDYGSFARTPIADAGALQFGGTAIDAAGPSISYTALTNTICTSGPTLAATISDPSGVNVTPGLAPRLYYRKGAVPAEADAFGTYPGDNTNAFNGWKYVEATGTAPNFTFVIDYSKLTSPMIIGDSLTYFIMAQDNNGVANVGKNVVTFSGTFCPTSVDLSGITNTTSLTNGYRIIGIPTTQPATTAVTAGSINNQVLRIDIPANQCGTLTQLDFTELSTASADIARARVYYTNTTTFATTTQFGADFISPTGSYVIGGTQALSTTLPNYFWLVYDINCAAPSAGGNIADASVTAATVGGVITVPGANQNPTGTRTINSLPSAFLSNQPSTATVQQGAIGQQVYRLDIPATSCGNITNIDFLNASGTASDVTAARVYYTTTTTFSTATQFGTDFVNPGATFSITGSVAPSATLTNYFWLVYDINCAATVANLIDGGATSITIGGTPQAVPALIQNPTGTRAVAAAVVGDNITSAPIAVIGAAATNAYTIVGKTLEAGEPSPILNTNGGGAAGTSNYSWGTAAGATAWYRLDVPLSGEGSSGNLLISASTVGGSSSTDCQVALWEFPSMTTGCGVAPNYTGARLLQANDDAFTGFAASGGTLNSTIRCRVTPGNTYYIQVDGFGTATPNGNVYVEDLSFAPYSTVNGGLGSYHNPTGVDMQFAAYEVNGTDGWTYYYNNNATVIGTATVPNIADDKVLVAKNWSANPNFTYRGTYLPGTEMVNHVKRSANSITAPSTTGVLSNTDSIIVWSVRNAAAGASGNLKLTAPYVVTPTWHMMNKFWNTVPKVQPTNPVGIRFFYSDQDYTDVNTAAGGIMAQHSDLKFLKFTKSLSTHYTNAEVDPALGQATITAGTANYLTWINTDGVEAGINQAQFNVTSFSGGGGGAALNNPLPIVVNYLRGAKQGSLHNLNWKVTCTSSPTATMILERSGDNRIFTAINSVTADQVRCAQPFDYVDASPLIGLNYYRLKIIDANGKVTYSNTIAMTNTKTGVTIVGIAPNPVTSNGNATLSVASAQKGMLRLVVTDVTGRQISVQSQAIIAGSNQIPMNFGKLAAGSYNITAITDDGNRTSVRFVKQ